MLEAQRLARCTGKPYEPRRDANERHWWPQRKGWYRFVGRLLLPAQVLNADARHTSSRGSAQSPAHTWRPGPARPPPLPHCKAEGWRAQAGCAENVRGRHPSCRKPKLPDGNATQDTPLPTAGLGAEHSIMPPLGPQPCLMAMPSEPEVSGFLSRMSRPLWVTVEGLACTVAPHISISMRR